ncbi:MAG: hypothetical protein RDU20_05695 [Desulfomonilaceae bacterium]|nr:hypothetical protein [Desulfomonilaceae bacterium]
MVGSVWELARILRTRRLASEELERIRNDRLRSVVRNAFDHVPYYRSLFLSAGLGPDDIRTVEDLPKLPITTKRDLRAAGLNNITARWADLGSCVTITGNGTTGEPFATYRTRSEQRTYFMLFMASLLSIGFRPTDRLCILGPVWPMPRRIHHRLGLFRRTVIPFSLSLEDQVRRLKEFQPTILWFYPSVLRAVMHYLKKPLREIIRPRILIGTAEVLDDVLRDRLNDELDADCFDLYGSSEFGPLAWECHAHEGLHLCADHFVFECLDSSSGSEAEPDAHAVVTSLYGYAMPFLRYRLEDLCDFDLRRCSCGSAFPLIGPVKGRENDLIKLPSGRCMSPLALQTALKRLPMVDQWRVVQESTGDLIVELAVNTPPVGQSFLDETEQEIRSLLGEPVNVEIRLVDFARDGKLKFKTFVSKIELPDSEARAVERSQDRWE